jgi:hypothetical protein
MSMSTADKRPKDIIQWELQRAAGCTWYVLQRGVLGWGGPMFVVMTFVVNRSTPTTPWWLLRSIVIWGLAGAGFGFTMWWMMERKYQKYLQSNTGQTAPTPPDRQIRNE